MKEKGKTEGLQDQDKTALDTHQADDLENYESGDELYTDADRDAIMERYNKHQEDELRKQGIDPAKLMAQEEEPETEGQEKEPEEEEKTGEEEQHDKDVGDVEKKETETEDQEAADKETEESKDKQDKPQFTLDDLLKQKVTVKIDGKESEVTVEQMRKNFQLEGHLTNQLQDVSRQKAALQTAALQLQRQVEEERAQIEEVIKEYLSPEDQEKVKKAKENASRVKAAKLQNDFIMQQNILAQAHPDAAQLDYDPEFVEFRQHYFPELSEQLFFSYGPEVFFPAMRVAMTFYKDMKTMRDALQQAQDTGVQLRSEREKALQAREAQQRDQKKKAQSVKPSTSQAKKGDENRSQSNEDYVTTMKKSRQAAQGISYED